MTEQATITTKVTPETLVAVRAISSLTGEKKYRIFERLAKMELTKLTIKSSPKSNSRRKR